MKDVLTGELHDTYTEEYRDSMLDKSCLDCKCSSSLAAFYNPLYRTRIFSNSYQQRIYFAVYIQVCSRMDSIIILLNDIGIM